MLREECKGCAMLRNTSHCLLVVMKKDEWLETYNCPCFKCLVKVMCIDSCYEADTYFNKVSQLKQKARKKGEKKINEKELRLWQGKDQ
jgi:hypothetical protein